MLKGFDPQPAQGFRGQHIERRWNNATPLSPPYFIGGKQAKRSRGVIGRALDQWTHHKGPATRMKTYTRSLIPRARDMRTNMTEPEKRLWFQCLTGLPHRFRRQRPFGAYIVDFYCAARKLVIEIDGDSHCTAEAIEYDAERTAFLQGLGLRVIRFSNDEVMSNLEGVSERILNEIGPPSIPPIS